MTDVQEKILALAKEHWSVTEEAVMLLGIGPETEYDRLYAENQKLKAVIEKARDEIEGHLFTGCHPALTSWFASTARTFRSVLEGAK